MFLYPHNTIERLAQSNYSPSQLFMGYSLWIGLIPPISALIGMQTYGWSFGVTHPITLSATQAFVIALFYAAFLMLAFFTTAFIIKWMASVYAPKANLKDCFAVVSVAGTPVVVGGIAHLYPNILFHIIVLAPVFAWSTYVMFLSLPTLLKTDTDKAVFMGCWVLIYLVSAFLSLLGLSVVMWVDGIGPNLGT